MTTQIVTLFTRHDYRIHDPDLLVRHGRQIAADDAALAGAYGAHPGAPMPPLVALRLVLTSTPPTELAEYADDFGLTACAGYTAAATTDAGIVTEVHEDLTLAGPEE